MATTIRPQSRAQPREHPRRAAVYVRISKDEAGDELGVARQAKLCGDVLDRLGWEHAATFTDNNMSAFKRGKRPQYDELVMAIRRGDVNAIAVYNPDRLSRDDMRGLEDLIDLLNEYDVAVETVRSGTFDLSTSFGRAQARMAGVWARLESEKMSERLTDKHAELVAAGKPNGGPRPFGYRRVGAKSSDGTDTRALIPHPEEAPIVAELVGRVAMGETLTRIADDLNARGIATSRGARWTISSVRRVALNGRYAKRRFHRGEEVGEGNWPQLVDEAIWRRARALLTDPARGVRRSSRRYLLTGGLLVCGKCGATMRSKPHHTSQGIIGTYTCPPSTAGGCGGVSVRAEAIEQYVAEETIRQVESAAFARALAKRSTGDPAAAATAAKLEAEEEALQVAFESEALTVVEVVRMKASITERLTRARNRTAVDVTDAAAGRYAGRSGSLEEAWPNRTLDEQQAILRAVTDRVVVAPAGRGRRLPIDVRVKIDWRLG